VPSPEAVYSRGSSSPGNRQRFVFGHPKAQAMVNFQPPGTAHAVTDFLGRPRLGLLEGFNISLTIQLCPWYLESIGAANYTGLSAFLSKASNKLTKGWDTIQNLGVGLVPMDEMALLSKIVLHEVPYKSHHLAMKLRFC
jgi:hypothetical protein